MEPAEAIVEDRPGRFPLGGQHEVEVAVVVEIERGQRGVPALAPDDRVLSRPGAREVDRKPMGRVPIARHRGRRTAVVAIGDVRRPLSPVRRPGVIHDIEVEVAVLVEVEPAGGQADVGGLGEVGCAADVVKPAAEVAEEPVVADAGQEQVDLAIGVEVARSDPKAGAVVVEPPGRCRILERPAPLIQQQRIAHASRSEDGGGQVEVEPAVTVGVERGRGRPEPPLELPRSRLRADQVRGPRPSPARRQGDVEGDRLVESRRRAGRADTCRTGERVDQTGVTAKLAVSLPGRVARRARIVLRVEALPEVDDLGLLGAVSGPSEGRLQLVEGAHEVGVAFERPGIEGDEHTRLLRAGGTAAVVGIGEGTRDPEPGRTVFGVAFGDKDKIAVRLVDLTEFLADQAPAIVCVEVSGIARDHPVEQPRGLVEP